VQFLSQWHGMITNMHPQVSHNFDADCQSDGGAIFHSERKLWGHVMLGKMKTDKSQFDEVLRRMLEKPPQKTSAIHAKKAPKKVPPLGQK
jgi:hypothetical protein